MSDASTALSSVAITTANLAQEAADRAECLVRMRDYNNDAATARTAREYASCVYTVYGTGRPISLTELLFLKAAFLLTVIGAVIGTWRMWRHDHELGMAAVGFLMGALAGVSTVAVLAGLWFGFRFVFS